MAFRSKSAARPVLQVTNDFSANPYTFPGPLRPIWCSKHHFTGPWPCKCPPGPQVVLLNPLMAGTPVPDVVATGGARGGTKTHSLLALAAFRGNPKRIQEAIARGAQPTQADLMYIGHKNYRGLILRPQSADLLDILDRAEEMYGPTGAVITRGSTPIAEWPQTGAKIVFGHFLEDGWKKYVGPEYQFIGIDQIEMMAQEETFHRIVGSNRSKWPELHPMVLVTFNPGGGDDMKGAPGQGWLMEYFQIEAYLDGRVPRYGAIRDEEGKLRMFVPSKVQDNPYFLYTKPELAPTKDAILCFSCKSEIPIPLPERPDEEINVCPSCKKDLLSQGSYLKWLNGIQPESLRRAWRDGDMRAMSGMYFKDYRPNGPLAGEPDSANHIYDPENVRIEPWWHSWASLDWGYIHPTDIQFHRKSPWGQVFTSKEISLKRVEPFELGVLIAREVKPIIEGLEGKHLNLYMSPDAYAKRDSENTVASQIAAGIKKELGPGSVFLADLTDDERELRDAESALASMHRRRQEQRSTMITMIKASTDRVAGWMHVQTMLRFRPLRPESVPDSAFADRLYQEKGLVAYKAYMNQPEFSANREVLPRWQISKECRELINCLPKAMHRPGTSDVLKFDATESAAGDDSIDCARYGLFSEEQQGVNFAPLEQRVRDRVSELEKIMPGMSDHSKIMAAVHANYMETSGKKQQAQGVIGHNRLAVRRAMMQQNMSERRLN